MLLLAPPGRLCAQQFSSQTAAGQIERSRLPDPTLPLSPVALSEGQPPEAGNTEDGLAPASSGDSDLGVQALLRTPPLPRPWTLFADSGTVYTSNVALTPHNTHGDALFLGEGGADYERVLGPDLSFSAAVREQYFAYNRFDDLSFGALNVAAGMSYTVHRLDDIVISAQLGFSRLTHHGLADNEFFRGGNLELGAQKLFTIGRAQLISVGGDTNLGVSVPHVAEREEFGVSAGYILQITRHLSIETGTRAAYFLYASTGRQDFNGSGNVGVTYAFAPWCSVGGTISGTLDRSSRPIFSYDVGNSGGSVFFRLRF